MKLVREKCDDKTFDITLRDLDAINLVTYLPGFLFINGITEIPLRRQAAHHTRASVDTVRRFPKIVFIPILYLSLMRFLHALF